VTTPDGRAALGAARPSGIGDLLVSSRSFAEYQRMFALTDRDFAGRILDCPGGAAGFTAEATAAGGTVRACDPVYDSDPDQLARRAESELRRAGDYVQQHPDEYEWSFFDRPDDYYARRRASAALFIADYREHRERYVTASLPVLPFPEGAFDLVLCSHFLFSYADRFDLAFHAAAIVELVRVSTGAVRIYPVFPMGSGPLLDLAPLEAILADQGISEQRISTTLVEVDYQFQRGEPVMLECRRA
jgi:hypothetical protein